MMIRREESMVNAEWALNSKADESKVLESCSIQRVTSVRGWPDVACEL